MIRLTTNKCAKAFLRIKGLSTNRERERERDSINNKSDWMNTDVLLLKCAHQSGILSSRKCDDVA